MKKQVGMAAGIAGDHPTPSVEPWPVAPRQPRIDAAEGNQTKTHPLSDAEAAADARLDFSPSPPGRSDRCCGSWPIAASASTGRGTRTPGQRGRPPASPLDAASLGAIAKIVAIDVGPVEARQGDRRNPRLMRRQQKDITDVGDDQIDALLAHPLAPARSPSAPVGRADEDRPMPWTSGGFRWPKPSRDRNRRDRRSARTGR